MKKNEDNLQMSKMKYCGFFFYPIIWLNLVQNNINNWLIFVSEWYEEGKSELFSMTIGKSKKIKNFGQMLVNAETEKFPSDKISNILVILIRIRIPNS